MYLGRRKLARSMHKDQTDLATFTSHLDVAADIRAAWPSEDVMVLAEHREVVEDLITLEGNHGGPQQAIPRGRAGGFTGLAAWRPSSSAALALTRPQRPLLSSQPPLFPHFSS